MRAFLIEFENKSPEDCLPLLLKEFDRHSSGLNLRFSFKSNVIRYAAAFLAHSFSPNENTPIIARLAEDPARRDFAALLVQEMVLREHDLGADGIIADFWSELRKAGHPIAFLPLNLTPLEKEIISSMQSGEVEKEWGVTMPDKVMSSYRPSVSRAEPRASRIPLAVIHRVNSDSLEPSGPSRFKGAPLLGRDYDSSSSQCLEARTLAAVSSWYLHSNGEAEAGTFKVDEIEEERLADLLLSMDLKFLEKASAFIPDCVVGDRNEVLEPAEVWVWKASAAEIMAVLFNASFYGGVHGVSNFGAIARLQAFETISALAGLDPALPFAEGLDRIERTAWYGFEAETPRFWRIIPDIAILAVRPQDGTAAVLCASDVD